MPREQRKRGKKKPKAVEPEVVVATTSKAQESHSGDQYEAPSEDPMWMRPENPNADIEAPFGYVDGDVKAYFRTVDVRMKEWQAGEEEGDHLPQEVDPNEDRKAFVVAALREMSGKELQLATDPDCATILERMAYSMDDFVRRVFIDTLAGSYERLITHRFASHVCQTHITLARDTLSRESRGIIASRPDEAGPSSSSELPSMADLIYNACEEILPLLSKFMMDSFGSHVIRALLLLLSPSLAAAEASSSGHQHAALRSKKSAAFKARQGPMKSVFVNDGQIQNSGVNSASAPQVALPKKLRDMAGRFVEAVRTNMGDNDIRALANDKVANPVLQLLMKIEAERGEAGVPGSLMDRILMGMITHLKSDSSTPPPREDYIETLLRDPTSSHLLEVLLSSAPPVIFRAIWATYFAGRLSKMVLHPVSNFVVAKAIERLDPDEMQGADEEIGGSWDKSIKVGRTGVLKAMIERAAATSTLEKEMVEGVYKAFGLVTPEDQLMLVPCGLQLKTLSVIKSAAAELEQEVAIPSDLPPEIAALPKYQTSNKKKVTQAAFSTQGAVLLQAMLRMHDPYNAAVVDSVLAYSIPDLLNIACDPTGSRVLDVVLDSPTIPPRTRRRLITSLIGHFHTLVDDKLGSRVADRCWAASDPYLKEKIAKSLIPHERFLAGSFYGKFFARNLHLTLLQRKPDEWKVFQSKNKKELEAAVPVQQPKREAGVKTETNDSHSEPKRKRKRAERGDVDEIDGIFAGGGGHHSTGVVTKPLPTVAAKITGGPDLMDTEVDDALKGVLGAIKDVPKGQALQEGRKKRKK